MSANLTPPQLSAVGSSGKVAARLSAFLTPPPTHPKVLRYLEERGFTTDDAECLSWYEGTTAEARAKLALHQSMIEGAEIALIMPCYNADGTRDPQYHRAIIFPAADAFPDGKAHLKLSPSARKVPNRVMFLPGVDYARASKIVLCESLPKAAFVHKRLGLPAVGLNGVDGWSPADFAELPPEAEIVFLSDSLKVESRRNIEHAARRLTAVFGGRLKWAHPPPPPTDWPKADWGIDDAVRRAGDHGEWLFGQVMGAARPVTAGETNAIVTSAAADILQREPARWIVKNLIPAGELVAIVGATNCGKTFLTMDLLLAVSRGETHWLLNPIKRHGLAVHITLEGAGLPFRLRAYREYHKLTDADLRNYRAIEVPVNLRDDKQTDAVIAAIAALGQPVALIAVDTVNRALGGGDENSSQDMGAMLGNAERIKAAFPESAVLLVHHLGKDEKKGARGHSSLSCNVGAELHVTNDEKSGIRTVSVEKQRDGRTGGKFNFQLGIVDVGHDEDGQPETSCIVEVSAVPLHQPTVATHEDNYRMLYGNWLSVRNGQPISRNIIARESSSFKDKGAKRVTRDDLLKAWDWAASQGLLSEAGKAGPGMTYKLTPPAQRSQKYRG